MNCGMCWLAWRPSRMSSLAATGVVDRGVVEVPRGGEVLGLAGAQRVQAAPGCR